MSCTAYSNHTRSNWVVTYSSLPDRCFNDHEILTSGIGKSDPFSRSDYCSRRRAFNRASAIVYCNQSKLTTFLTLTYKNQHSNYQKILNDLKNHFSRRKISYIGVVERHRSGMYHMHLMTSDLPNVISLRKGKYSWSDWKLGFSDVKSISEVDSRFRVELYIFKYMMKADRIGGRFILKSRDLTVRRTSYRSGSYPAPVLHEAPIDFSLTEHYNGNGYNLIVTKEYYNGYQNPRKPRNLRDFYLGGLV